jgi:hypothetical protein
MISGLIQALLRTRTHSGEIRRVLALICSCAGADIPGARRDMSQREEETPVEEAEGAVLDLGPAPGDLQIATTARTLCASGERPTFRN